MEACSCWIVHSKSGAYSFTLDRSISADFPTCSPWQLGTKSAGSAAVSLPNLAFRHFRNEQINVILDGQEHIKWDSLNWAAFTNMTLIVYLPLFRLVYMLDVGEYIPSTESLGMAIFLCLVWSARGIPWYCLQWVIWDSVHSNESCSSDGKQNLILQRGPLSSVISGAMNALTNRGYNRYNPGSYPFLFGHL